MASAAPLATQATTKINSHRLIGGLLWPKMKPAAPSSKASPMKKGALDNLGPLSSRMGQVVREVAKEFKPAVPSFRPVMYGQTTPGIPWKCAKRRIEID